MGNDFSVVRAARVSYAKDQGVEWKDSDAGLIKFMANHGHGTPFEHTAVTFHVACPLFVRGQWHRHRIGWSYNEISRRYTSDEIHFHAPNEWRMQNKSGNKQGSQAGFGWQEQSGIDNQYINFISAAEMLFIDLIDQGVANEQARMVLPQSMYTRFYATCNLRSAAHFMGLRDDTHAQPEIRAYAKEMREQLRVLYPVSIAALMGE
jgi:thymidylate synthase (FAD)